MSNPYFNNDPYFGDTDAARKERQRLGLPASAGAPAPGNYPGGYQANQGPTTTLPPVPLPMEDLERAYAMPSASAAETGRMTYDDVIMKTSIVLGTIVLFGALAWWLPDAMGSASLHMGFLVVGLIGGLILGLVNAFRKQPSPGLILAYAAFEGLFLGAISFVFEAQWSGIVIQAVLATVAVFATVLVLFRSGKVRNSPKFQRTVLVAMVGYLVFSLVNLVLMWTGVLSNPWGVRGMTIMGIPLGLVIGVVAVLLAAASLVIDFDTIQQGVRRGAPARYAWAAAFGLAVTLVWLYLEFLRLLAILRGND